MTRITLTLSLAACLMAACLSAGESADRTPGRSDRPNDSLRNMLVINEDNSHFFGSRKPEAMSRAGLHAFVDQYAGSAVTHLAGIRQITSSNAQQIVWVEMRLQPK